ncbi:hypothetical protein SL1157_1698 [Ruegeria lacuscaerulensis ITI-1157]|nr:hypothetical protein SL1157_0383 [Ruegeria lacuscaerulensis ITI-1157]EEX09654.1 hypothetical protein SL1157_1698 [Ruegeria lacuscaerulensis ITI-1157]SHK24924.1 hypothetical protein SAMN05444404_3560 [Ruegeria lacuscaerulensis ITI-1157]
MADTPSSTPHPAAEPLNALISSDKLAFRAALDQLFVALRADWLLYETRADLNSEPGMELGDTAASAWSLASAGLRAVRDMRAAHPDLRTAAGQMLRAVEDGMPNQSDLLQLSGALFDLARSQKAAAPDLHALLMEAQALIEAWRGNLALMGLPRAA